MTTNSGKRLALGVSYRGTRYCGWQKQAHSDNTVQYHVEAALSQVANHPVSTRCAGRTDSGVHSTGQVIHMDTMAERSAHNWQSGTNRYLPRDIRINWVKTVDSDFHARFSAIYRRYHYVIEDNSVGHAIFTGLVTPYRYRLDVEKMHRAAQCLLGEQDFSSFRASQCQSNTSFRHIDFVNISRSHDNRFVIVDIQANAFLYHMVRNIVGALLMVGRGKYSSQWLEELLLARDRKKAPATASADGLYLIAVGYPSTYHLSPGARPF